MSLQPLVETRKLREALHAKAKRAPDYRFYALYDKVYRRDVLGFAYACSLENKGAAGVDGQTFADIEEYGEERWLDELAEELRFLGYTFGRWYSPRTGGSYLGVRPSAKTIQKICAAISEQTRRGWVYLDPEELVGRLNRMLRGWTNYFRLGAVSAAYRIVGNHVCHRLRQWLGKRERVQGSSRARYSEPYLRRQGAKSLRTRMAWITRPSSLIDKESRISGRISVNFTSLLPFVDEVRTLVFSFAGAGFSA